jgi:hypothetical protein
MSYSAPMLVERKTPNSKYGNTDRKHTNSYSQWVGNITAYIINQPKKSKITLTQIGNDLGISYNYIYEILIKLKANNQLPEEIVIKRSKTGRINIIHL